MGCDYLNMCYIDFVEFNLIMFLTLLFISPDFTQLPQVDSQAMVSQAQTATTLVRIIPSDNRKPIIPRGATVTVLGRRVITLAHGGNAVVYDIQYQGHNYVVGTNEIRF